MTIMVDRPEEIGVAEAKAKLSELLARVGRGERFLVARRGTPLAALVPLDEVQPAQPRFLGLAAFAGGLEGWDDLPEFVEEVYRARDASVDREVPDLS